MDQLVLEGSTYLQNAADSLRHASRQFALVDSSLTEVVENMAIALERQVTALQTVHQTALRVLATSQAQPPARELEEESVASKLPGKPDMKKWHGSEKSKQSSRKRPASAPTRGVHAFKDSLSEDRSSDISWRASLRKKCSRAVSKSTRRQVPWRPTSVDKGIPKL